MKKTIFSLMLLAISLGLGAQGGSVAILSNKNFPECREAAEVARKAAPAVGILPSNVPILQLDGSKLDAATLDRLRALDPKIVISIGTWATGLARKTLPNAWVVHALVPYPEVEGFTKGPKMIGVSPFGLEKDLFAAANSMAPVKRLAVIHSEEVSPSVGPMLARLKRAGFDPADFSLSQAPLVEDVMRDVSERFQGVLLLPDPLTSNPYVLRFLVTKCIEKGIMPLSLDRSLVTTGVLCAAFSMPETSGWEAAALAGKLLRDGEAGKAPVTFTERSKVAINLSTAQSLRVKVPSLPNLVIQ